MKIKDLIIILSKENQNSKILFGWGEHRFDNGTDYYIEKETGNVLLPLNKIEINNQTNGGEGNEYISM